MDSGKIVLEVVGVMVMIFVILCKQRKQDQSHKESELIAIFNIFPVLKFKNELLMKLLIGCL